MIPRGTVFTSAGRRRVDTSRDRFPDRAQDVGAWGFTLVEVLIVVALLGVLASSAFLVAQGLIQRGKAGATATQLAFMRTGLLNLATDCEGLPVSAKGKGDPGLAYSPKGSTCWRGPYLARWPTSTPFGSGTTFQYQGKVGTMASLSAQSLTASDAQALASQVAPMFGGQASLGSSKKVWSVSVNVGNFY